MKQLSPRDVLAYSVTAPHLAGGLIVHNGRVVMTQTLVRFMGGWTLWQVLKYCDWRGWVLQQERLPI